MDVPESIRDFHVGWLGGIVAEVVNGSGLASGG